jgi:hypothetical protein
VCACAPGTKLEVGGNSMGGYMSNNGFPGLECEARVCRRCRNRLGV